MSRFNRLIIAVTVLFAVIFAAANLLYSKDGDTRGRPYEVEAERLLRVITEGNDADISGCEYITAVTADDGTAEFYSRSGSCLFRSAAGRVYRFDYTLTDKERTDRGRLLMNLFIAAGALLSFGVLFYVRQQIIKPFSELSEVPYQLSRGNLAIPLRESRSRYFGRYIWGTEMLRESIDARRSRELELMKQKQTLIMSVSHDIKTPLSAIRLYSSALQRGLYRDGEKLMEVYKSIDDRAREIERYTTDLMNTAGAEPAVPEVKAGEMYISELIGRIEKAYADRHELSHTELRILPYTDCLISCDPERAAEVMQNLMENAIKYGDGAEIELRTENEDGCKLLTVTNSGCTLSEEEMPHIFDSFWRGSNAKGKTGSGLGLYICRTLMTQMNGSIFAKSADGKMSITAVFAKV